MRSIHSVTCHELQGWDLPDPKELVLQFKWRQKIIATMLLQNGMTSCDSLKLISCVRSNASSVIAFLVLWKGERHATTQGRLKIADQKMKEIEKCGHRSPVCTAGHNDDDERPSGFAKSPLSRLFVEGLEMKF